jgi:hypothetical protein
MPYYNYIYDLKPLVMYTLIFISYFNNSTSNGRVFQKALNKLPEDGILNAETCRSEKGQNYIE